MRKLLKDKKTVANNVAKALAEVPIDNKQERDALRARLRRKYGELKRLRTGMREEDRKRFDEMGELIKEMDKCERRSRRRGS
jgi:phage-related protein